MIQNFTPFAAIMLDEQTEASIQEYCGLNRFNARLKKLFNLPEEVIELTKMLPADILTMIDEIDYCVVSAKEYDAVVSQVKGIELAGDAICTSSNRDGVGLLTIYIDNLRKEHQLNNADGGDIGYEATYDLTAKSTLVRMMRDGTLFIDEINGVVHYCDVEYSAEQVAAFDLPVFKTPWDTAANLLATGCLFSALGYIPPDDVAEVCNEYVINEWQRVQDCIDEDGKITSPCFTLQAGTAVPYIREYVETIFACDLALLIDGAA